MTYRNTKITFIIYFLLENIFQLILLNNPNIDELTHIYYLTFIVTIGWILVFLGYKDFSKHYGSPWITQFTDHLLWIAGGISLICKFITMNNILKRCLLLISIGLFLYCFISYLKNSSKKDSHPTNF